MVFHQVVIAETIDIVLPLDHGLVPKPENIEYQQV